MSKKTKIIIFIVLVIIFLAFLILPNVLNSEDLIGIMISIFFRIFAALIFFSIFILPIILGIKFAFKSTKAKDNFECDTEYYRGLLKDYSLAVLSYTYSLNIDVDKNIVITLMSLSIKNKIQLKDKIEIINSDFTNLKPSEIYIMNHIKNGQVDLSLENFEMNKLAKLNTAESFKQLQALETFQNTIIKEANDDGLILKHNSKVKYSKALLVLILTYALLKIISFIFTDSGFMNIFVGGPFELFIVLIAFMVGILTIMFPFIALIFFIGYIASTNAALSTNRFRRSKKGQEIMRRLIGLKNYIEDFSRLDERKAEELKLWDYYLIYAVMFDVNSIIDKEYKKYIIKLFW